MNIRLKIRGIYATALTQLFLDKNFQITDPTGQIQERFGPDDAFQFDKPATVEIEDKDDWQGILLTGTLDSSQTVISMLQEELYDAICRKLRVRDNLIYYEVEFPFIAKSILDEIRNQVVPTIRHHHRMRIIASEYVDMVERLELSNHPEKREQIGRRLEQRFIWNVYRVGMPLAIEHVKLKGEVISLSHGEIREISPEDKHLILRRGDFSGIGDYDGLALSTEAGDYAMTDVWERGWMYSHNYYRADDTFIGACYNINTPVEYYPDKIRYIDLEIDVVERTGEPPETIDKQSLQHYYEQDFISQRLYETALEQAEKIVRTAEES
ncbi:MAG TPA: DUF402 domain-containing protein [bacterium]|nr:DUF402 domain-containing protein [bacterium]